MPRPTFCIVGAGLAGGRAAAALRDRGFDGRLVLIGSEPDPPYERPPLSKSYLRGDLPRSKLFLHTPASYRELAIEWRPDATVEAIAPAAHELALVGGERIPFDRLLLATGSKPRGLPISGTELAGVSTYRTIRDADALRAQLEQMPEVVIVGGGFLGSELAAAARLSGCRVTVVEAAAALLSPLGPIVGGYCADLHRQSGVRVLLGESVASFQGGSRVERILLRGGGGLPCDLALVCVGAEPNAELAAVAGLETDPGVVVDEHCRSTDKTIFAAGDVASWWSPRWQHRMRVEHYDNAHQQGLFVAGAMIDQPGAYDPLPYFWTEQYDTMVQQIGVLYHPDEVVRRGEANTGRFSVFYLRHGTLSGCVAVNNFSDLSAARRLIAARVPVTAELLGDLAVDLRDWSRGAVAAAQADRP
jgi:3-phenylpropionate/trans-cinnamate dioxygenase ferredoxin reductase component